MPSAGEYVDRLRWQQRVKGGGGRDSHGQPIDSHPVQGYLWGVVEDVAGGRTSAKESEREDATATIRIRNYPAVVAGDRLTDADGATWSVDSVVKGQNEIRCDVRRPRWTAGGGTAA